MRMACFFYYAYLLIHRYIHKYKAFNLPARWLAVPPLTFVLSILYLRQSLKHILYSVSVSQEFKFRIQVQVPEGRKDVKRAKERRW